MTYQFTKPQNREAAPSDAISSPGSTPDSTTSFDAAAAIAAAKAPRRHNLRQVAIGLLASTAIVGIATFAINYWTTGRFEVETDDAYVAADSTAIAPKVSGYIKEVRVTDNELVKAGEVLATIDDADFKTALEQANANVAAARADIGNIEAQIEQQKQSISAARSSLVIDDATQALAQQDYQRYSDLVKTGYGTVQRAQQAEATIRQAAASVSRDQAVLAGALKQSDVLAATRAKAEAAVRQADAAAHQAELNLSYATITAPVDGTVGARALRVGAFVQAGSQLMQVVPLHAVYITANFKETQLTHVQAGQPVNLEVDTYPGLKISGHVDSLSPASGQEFALLPPDNATGNFTKIVQRIPVKIMLDHNPALRGKLRPGMSVEAMIDTKPAGAGSTLPVPFPAALAKEP